MNATTTRPMITVTADGRGWSSRMPGRGCWPTWPRSPAWTPAFGEALAGLRERRSAHDPGRVLVDLAVMLADGGEAISDLARAAASSPSVFGPVASTATAWRVLDSIDADRCSARLRAARAAARERAWLARAELGRPAARSAVRAGGRCWPGLVIDVDATLVTCAQREGARRGHVQGRVRLPPAAGVPGQHRRGAGRGAAPGQRRREHRRRPHRGHRPGVGADPRRRARTGSRS